MKVGLANSPLLWQRTRCVGVNAGNPSASCCVFGVSSVELKQFSCYLWDERQSHHPIRVCHNPPSLSGSLSVVFVSPLLFSLRRSFATVSIWKKPTVSGRPPNTPYWLTGRYKEPLCLKVQDSRGCAVLSSAIPAGPFFVFGALSGSLLTIPTNASWTPVEHPVNGKDIFIKVYGSDTK